MSSRIKVLAILTTGLLLFVGHAQVMGGSEKTTSAQDRVTETAIFETNATQGIIIMGRDPKTNDRVTGATSQSQQPQPQDGIGPIHIEPQIAWPPNQPAGQ